MDSICCSFVRFPTHLQRQHRNRCGEKIYKEVKLSNGEITYHPLLVYCYKSVIDSLQEMLNRLRFFEHCEAWCSQSMRNTL